MVLDNFLMIGVLIIIAIFIFHYLFNKKNKNDDESNFDRNVELLKIENEKLNDDNEKMKRIINGYESEKINISNREKYISTLENTIRLLEEKIKDLK